MGLNNRGALSLITVWVGLIVVLCGIAGRLVHNLNAGTTAPPSRHVVTSSHHKQEHHGKK
jgi:hypothetical protein